MEGKDSPWMLERTITISETGSQSVSIGTNTVI